MMASSNKEAPDFKSRCLKLDSQRIKKNTPWKSKLSTAGFVGVLHNCCQYPKSYSIKPISSIYNFTPLSPANNKFKALLAPKKSILYIHSKDRIP